MPMFFFIHMLHFKAKYIHEKKIIFVIFKFGLKPKLFNWFESFYAGRRQRIVLSETVSECTNVTSRFTRV